MTSPPCGLTRGEFLKLTAAGIGLVSFSGGRLLLADGTVVLTGSGPPDTILVNGQVLTMDAADSTQRSLALRGGIIQAVGTDAAIRALAGPSTEVIDLSGRTVTPGLIDSHLHFQLVGLMGKYFIPFIPPDVTNVTQLQAALAAYVKTIPKGSWVNGYYSFGVIPAAKDLDPASPDHPVFLMNQPGHIGSANSKAMQVAGITAATASPVGGIVEKDAAGNPTGVFYNHRAMDMVRKYCPPFTMGQQRDSIASTQRVFAAYGVTGYHDNNVRGAANIKTYFDLARENQLWLRGQVSFTLEYVSEVETALAVERYASPFMRLAGYKFLIDGQSPTAYCHEPHNGTSWDMPTWEPGSFKRAVRTLHETGLQICVHCVGDAATDLVLDAFEEAMNAHPLPNTRHRIEHAILTRKESTQRMKDLGVVLGIQTQFIRYGGDTYESVFGSERMKRIVVTREWLDAGVPVALSSDGPTTPWLSPGVTLSSAMVRQTASGKVVGADQALTIREALRAHTRTAAFAIFKENELGSLEPGKAADVIVWTRDPLTATPQQIWNATIDLALVGGRVVYPLGPSGSWIVPSSAHSQGQSTFWTTDVTIANTGDTDAGLTIRFLGHDQDGRTGTAKDFALGAGKSATFPDILSRTFGQASAWGALQITADTPDLAVTTQTSTPATTGSGTFGQSVPGCGPADLVVSGLPRSILAIREDATYRTNLILANASEAPVDVDVTLVLEDGTRPVAARRYSLLPLGMTQETNVVRKLGVSDDVSGARLVLSTDTANGAFAAYAACIDNRTGDPRTLLPR